MTPAIGLATWLTAVLAGAAVAPPPPTPAAPALDAPAAVADGGLVVFRDPATGRPTAVAPEGVTFSQLSPVVVVDQQVRQRRSASGGWVANVPESLFSYAVVSVGPDGQPVWTCVDGADAAETFLATGVARDANGEEVK